VARDESRGEPEGGLEFPIWRTGAGILFFAEECCPSRST